MSSARFSERRRADVPTRGGIPGSMGSTRQRASRWSVSGPCFWEGYRPTCWVVRPRVGLCGRHLDLPATAVIPTAVPDPLHIHTSTTANGGTR